MPTRIGLKYGRLRPGPAIRKVVRLERFELSTSAFAGLRSIR
jgi:hypothetical protein